MMKKIALFAFVAVLLVAGAIYYGFKQSTPFVPPKGTISMQISATTTILTEPRLPNGENIDFLAVLDQLSSANADSENNGFREIVRLGGRSIFDIPDEKWVILCDKLHLNPDDPPLFHYQPLPAFLKDAVGDNQAFQILSSLEKRKEDSAEHLELLKRWVEEMEPAISAVAEALKMPIYVVPPTGKLSDFNDFFQEYGLDADDFDWPDFLFVLLVQREIVRMFIYRRLIRDIDNNTDNNHAERGTAQWNDVLAMFRIARHMGQYLEGLEIAVDFEKAAAFHATETLKNHDFDADKLRQCLADLESLPDLLNLTAYWDYQRFGWLKNISDFPRKGPAAFKVWMLPIPEHSPWITDAEKEFLRQANRAVKKVIRVYRTVPFDWNIIAEIMNAEFDELQGKSGKQTIFQSNPALRKLYDETEVPEYSFDDVLEIAEGGFIKVLEIHRLMDSKGGWNSIIAKKWDVRRWQGMSIEERSVYLGKAHFASYATPPEVFAYKSRDAATALDALKTAIALQLHEAE